MNRSIHIMIISTLAAMSAGFVLGTIFGVPDFLRADKYMRRLTKKLAPFISSKYQDNEGGRRTAGIVFIILLLAITLIPTIAVLILLYCFAPFLAIILDALLCWSVYDVSGVSRAAAALNRAVRAKNHPKAARIAGNISGCDCEDFADEDVVRSAVQGISDRTVDRAAAPLFYMFLLSGAGAVLYSAVNAAAAVCADMGDFAAPLNKLRDGLLFIPGKLAAVIMLVDALYLKLNTRAAEKTLKRDGKKSDRLCFGGCRAVLSGVLGISLLPEEVYDKEIMRTYTIGEHLKEPEAQDIVLSNQLMHGTAFIIMALCFIIKLTLGVWF